MFNKIILTSLAVIILGFLLWIGARTRDEINLQTGQIRKTTYCWYIKLHQETCDTLLSSYIPQPLSYVDGRVWGCIFESSFDLYFSCSIYRFQMVPNQIRLLEQVFATLNPTEEAKKKIVEGLMRQWQEANSTTDAQEYINSFDELHMIAFDKNWSTDEKNEMIESLVQIWQETSSKFAVRNYLDSLYRQSVDGLRKEF